VSFFSPDISSRPLRVGIVGGGPGGLFTAWHLEQRTARPLDITIYEASGRLGGKVLTPSFTAAPVRYEAGAAELYDYSPVAEDPLRELVEWLGLPTVAMGGGAVSMGDRRIANLDDVAEVLGSQARDAMATFDTWARSAMTPAEFYESGSEHAVPLPAGRFDASLDRIGLPTLRRYVETLIKSDLATEPAATTVGYGLQNYLMNDPAYMRLYCIAGGNEELIHSLASRVAAEVRLNTPVSEIGGEPGGPLEVVYQTADGQQREAYDIAILALPMDALVCLAYGDDQLAAAMQRHCKHHNHPADYLRITILFDKQLPAGHGDDSYIMLEAFGGCCLYLESGREPAATHGVLGWLVGGSAALAMAEETDDQLLAAAVKTLPEPFRHLRNHMLEGRVYRWRGAVSGVPGGWQPLPLDQRHRPAAKTHPNLFVVGDYLYDATLNGVLDAAEHVAGWVTAETSGSSQE
jgi:protoporphyrinogen oxidase